jgi:four helix bundle protein
MPASTKRYFDHEKLEVYQQSIVFVAWITPLLENLQKPGDVKDQLDRASTSIPLNIAEGNGKYSVKERCHHFDFALGSALECAAGLTCLSPSVNSMPLRSRPARNC